VKLGSNGLAGWGSAACARERSRCRTVAAPSMSACCSMMPSSSDEKRPLSVWRYRLSRMLPCVKER
jgi:hypothetical protein